jgi:dipeptidyl aminopeptidase/acylaminoacyl peptidase
MSRRIRLLCRVAVYCFTLIFLVIPPVVASPIAAIAVSNTIQEKIVFVRADPDVKVVSMRQITEVDPNTGDITGSHDAPDMQATTSGNSRRNRIGVMNTDGSNPVIFKIFGSDPTLSPDGTKIVYCSNRDSLYSQIYVVNSDGTGDHRLTNISTGDACGPAWAHDGKKIAFYAFALTQPNRNPQLWVMDPEGANQKKLTEHGLDPSWSPDDTQIAFASKRDGIFQIYVMNADGSNLRRLTNHNAEDSNPAWAPDGAAIAYISATGNDRRALYIMAPDGSGQHGIAHSKHQDFCFPAWSLDGRTLAFTALNRLGSQGIIVGEERPRCEMWSGEYQIFAMDGDGKIHQLSDTKLMGMRPSYGRFVSVLPH